MFSGKKYTFIFRAQLSRVCVCLRVLSVFGCIHLYGPQPTRLLCPWDSPGKNTGVGCYAFCRRSSQSKDELASFMSPALAGGFFTTSATWKTPPLSRQCSIVDLGQEDLYLLASNVQPWSNLWSYLSPSFIKCKGGNSIFFVSFTRILISSLKKFLAHLALIFIAFLINYYIKPRTNILRYILSSPIYNKKQRPRISQDHQTS